MPRTLDPPVVPGHPVLPEPVALPDAARAMLLDVARAAVAVAVRARPAGAIAEAVARHPPVDHRAAAFVTLTEEGDLRGCVGHMDAGSPVVESVIEAANSAALGDPRFPSVRADELPRLHLEVSVLGRLVRIADRGAWRLGVDGIIVERAGRRGLLLPEVAAMLGMSRTAMLDTACRKAGLPEGVWRDRTTTLYAFRTDRFGGPALEAAGLDDPVGT
jgi:AmmeMemoRadiSam system protein A